MKTFIVSLLFFSFSLSQTVLQFDQFITGTISPGELLNYTFTSPIDDGSILVEVTGPEDFTDQVTGNFNNPFIAVQFSIPGNSFGSTGIDINGRHGFGVVCNEDITTGQQFFLQVALPRSSVSQNFGLRVRAEADASLNNERIISEETCCFGAEDVSGKQYYLDIPAGETSATIFVTRDPNRPIMGPELFVDFGKCNDQLNPTYTFDLEVMGTSEITIDQTSTPPLQQGRYYVTMPRPGSLSSQFEDIREFYTMAACLGAGCSIDLPPPGSSGVSNDGNVAAPSIFAFVGIAILIFQ